VWVQLDVVRVMICVREVPSGAASGFAGEELVRERELWTG